jgi:release factor glutamine methyltransferase
VTGPSGLEIGALLRGAAARLAGLPQALPGLEAELLLAEATGLSRAQLFAWPERALAPVQAARFEALLARRLAGEPMAHIRGRQAFWTLELEVTPDTLIPRPETELLVETALELLAAEAPLLVADAGTGSGAIAAALAVERPAWTLVAIERGAAAAAVAARNLRRCAAANARLVRGDWLAPIAPSSLDAVVANPPYIPAGDPHLGRGDLPREPRSALSAGADGLDAVRRIAPQALARLKPGGLLALEHGFDQAAAVTGILAARGFERIATRRDLAGQPRVTLGRTPATS